MKLTNKNFSKSLLSSASISFTLILACACSDSNNNVAGGATDIGNSIAGIVVDANGAGVASARVVAYYDSWTQTTATDSVEAFTDASGNFTLLVDSAASYVLYAENGNECGLAFANDSANTLVLGGRKSLESSVNGETSGYVRIVGTHETAEIREDGSFAFDAIPPGDISLVYIRDEKPQGYLEFKTVDEREQIHLPPLENRRDDGHFNAPDFGKDMYGVDFRHHSDYRDMPPETVLHMDGFDSIYNSDHSKAKEVLFVDGVSNAAVSLSAGQYIKIENQSALGSDFTLSLWTKWNGANDNEQILFSEKTRGDSASQFQWSYDSAKNSFAVKAKTKQGSETIYFDASAMPTEKWTFLTLVSHNHAVAMYINGTAVPANDSVSATVDLNSTKNPASFFIGGNGETTSTWNGALDEFHIEGIAQSAGWIKDISESSQVPFRRNPGK